MLQRLWQAALLVTITLPTASADSSDRSEQAVIVGRVTSVEDGSALPGVSISLGKGPRPERKIVATTDIRGAYEIRELPAAADYLIRVDYAGFAPCEISPLEVNEGATVRLDIRLRSAALTTDVFIGGRWLDESELQLYLDAEKRIGAWIASPRLPSIDLILRALRDIESLPDVVQEDAREALRLTITSRLDEVTEPGNPLMLDLLRDPDPVIQGMGLSILWNQDTGVWIQDPELRSLLQELLQSPGEDVPILTGILLAYEFAGRFDEVRSTALAMARSGDLETEWEAASAIAFSHERSEDMAGLRRLFHESDGVLRQVAANWLAESFDPRPDADERVEIALELVRTMEDSSMSPEYRGAAIGAARWLRGEPILQEALLGLLEPDAWFSGVPSVCRSKHSLEAVIESLDARPEIESDLLKLKGQLHLLDADARRKVELELDDLLAKLRIAARPGETR